MISKIQDILTYAQSVITDLDIRSISIFLLQKLVEALLQAGVVVLLGWLVVYRQWRQLTQGRSDQVVFSANLLRPLVERQAAGEPERYLLQLRTVLPPKTVDQLLDNVALRKLTRQLAESATLTEPVLETEGTGGFEVLTDIVNNVSGMLAASSFPREPWLLALTCEDRRVVRKCCIRVLLIRRDDLEKLVSWDWCREHIWVEEWYHFWRVITLHQIALRFRTEQAQREQIRVQGASQNGLPLVDPQARHPRIRTLSLGINTNEPVIKPPCSIDWDRYLQDVAAAGLALPASKQ